MRPVEFGEALAAGTRLTLFSHDKPDRLFMVITFLIDAVSGVALDLNTGVPCYQVADEEGRIHYCFTCQSGEKMKAADASGGPIMQNLIPGPSLTEHWLRNREAGVMEERSIGVLD